MQREARIGTEEPSERLDVYLARKFSGEISRSRAKQLILSGNVLVNGKAVKPHYEIRPGDVIAFEITPLPPEGMEPEEIPLDIIHEDEDIIVINKPPGLVVHPGAGNREHTLVNALLHHTGALSALNGPIRPGIVHRLDKDTSGVILIAKTDTAHRVLARQFKNHEVIKVYNAFVKGVVQHDEMRCVEPVGRAFLNRKKVTVQPSGGKEAMTYFRVLQRFRQATLLEARPQTGRTHQIRVHLSHLGHPIIGDLLYGGQSPLLSRQALHARSLEITHPKAKQRMNFSAPLPADLNDLLVALSR